MMLWKQENPSSSLFSFEKWFWVFSSLTFLSWQISLKISKIIICTTQHSAVLKWSLMFLSLIEWREQMLKQPQSTKHYTCFRNYTKKAGEIFNYFLYVISVCRFWADGKNIISVHFYFNCHLAQIEITLSSVVGGT